jgi:phosphatidylglycerophosphate synthase
MPVITRAQAQAEALTIKNETVTNANTATRVGGMLDDLADSLPFLGTTFLREYAQDNTGTTNSTSITTIGTFSMSALTNVAGIAKAWVHVQDASNALAVQQIGVGFSVLGGVLQSGGAGTVLAGSVAQGTATFAYSGNNLLVRMTSSDGVVKAYKVMLETTYALKA